MRSYLGSLFTLKNLCICGFFQVQRNKLLEFFGKGRHHSSFAQEMMCYFGQSVVFEEASNLIKTLIGGDINAK
jgi:hypothetical protein